MVRLNSRFRIILKIVYNVDEISGIMALIFYLIMILQYCKQIGVFYVIVSVLGLCYQGIKIVHFIPTLM